jgi:hypothetical protein
MNLLEAITERDRHVDLAKRVRGGMSQHATVDERAAAAATATMHWTAAIYYDGIANQVAESYARS